MEILQTINWAIIAPIIVISFILITISIVDLIRNENTNGPKWLWVLIILFVSIIGPIIYFVIGRRQN